MNIGFLILKILYILMQVLLFLLLFILLLLLVILFTRIKYMCKINTFYNENNKKNDVNILFRATYLFSIIGVYVDVKDDTTKLLLKVFGKGVYRTILPEKGYEIDEPLIRHYDDDIDVDTGKKDDNINKEDYIKNEEADTKKFNKLEKEKRKIEKEKKRIDRKKRKVEKNVKKIERAKNLKNSDYKQDEELNELLDYFKNKDVILKMISAAIKLIKAVLPKKFMLRCTFGFSDPSKTGQLVGLLYTIKGVTNLDIVANGEFEKEIPPDIFCFVKGDFRIFNALISFRFILSDLLKIFIKDKYNIIVSRIKGE